MSRGSLARNIVVLTTVVAALTAALTALIAWQTAAHAAEQRERDQLTRQATVFGRLPDLAQLIYYGAQALGGPNGVQFAVIAPDGAVSGTATPAVAPATTAAVLAGRSVFTRTVLGGQDVLLLGQPSVRGGGVVLTEPGTVVAQDTDQIRRNTVLPLLVGMLGAALAGGLLARRIARPLASAAQVAHRLADGERGVRARPDGPREAAEIGRALGVLDKALVRSENRQREFLLSVSHELRTPLTALQGWAEALADGLVEPEQLPEVGRVLAGETGRLERFLGDLLDLARLEADDFRLHVTATDLAALAGEAAAFWSGSLSGEGAELRLEAPVPPHEQVLVDTDAFRVRQLVDGLLQNALRATPDDGTVVLTVRPASDGGAEVQVRDSGPGLTDDDVRVAFDGGALHARYRDTRPVGSGLGLAIAHRLTGRLGGTLAAEGHGPEGGAVFTVTLPSAAPVQHRPAAQ